MTSLKYEQNEKNKEGWEKVALAYSGNSASEDDPNLREFARNEFIKRISGKNVLEVGCGPGTDAAKFHELGFDVLATDYSSRFLDVVRERYPYLKVQLFDMVQPESLQQKFDGIFGFGCFIHIPRELCCESLRNLNRILKRGGVLCLQLIQSSKGIEQYYIDDWAGDPQCSMLFNCYAPAEIEAQLRLAGFTEVEFLTMPVSVYDEIPRLIERGINGYFVFARAA
ncbi:class I SAM-dependent methyltransferase [Vibrio hyugaensis]|uniref:class I SAM-dependent methyltransferase n=1 Tax=Vibrio hyugaensis TaxID=1534743 RepID=UPI0005ED5706|nr:class I SAM-dependent methyltransferase [Vibrio hyugaensis]